MLALPQVCLAHLPARPTWGRERAPEESGSLVTVGKKVREEKGRKGKGREGKGREGKGREGKERKGKGKEGYEQTRQSCRYCGR